MPTLYYAHDPMCSWCWGFSPAWHLLKKSVLHKYASRLEVVELLGGLAPDTDAPMPASMRQHLRDTWLEIKKRIPGTEFNFDFWTVCEPKRSTWPACRAVIAARGQGTDRADAEQKQDAMTKAIQKAYYLDARNPSSILTLVAIAEEIGLDKDRFTMELQSDALRQIHQEEMMKVRQLGVQGFPSLVMVIDQVAHRVLLDYSGLEKTLHHIERLMKTTEPAGEWNEDVDKENKVNKQPESADPVALEKEDNSTTSSAAASTAVAMNG
ncbi:MAG: DsbA family protein [Acidiferrobacterales bacterium]|nr:DsbA family protein [Acidiferrobacterales bacterium]